MTHLQPGEKERAQGSFRIAEVEAAPTRNPVEPEARQQEVVLSLLSVPNKAIKALFAALFGTSEAKGWRYSCCFY